MDFKDKLLLLQKLKINLKVKRTIEINSMHIRFETLSDIIFLCIIHELSSDV